MHSTFRSKSKKGRGREKMSFDREPDLEIGDIIRLGAHHWVRSDKGRTSEWKEDTKSTRFKEFSHLRFKITGFRPFDGEKDVVEIEPINGKIKPGPKAPYGWMDRGSLLSVSCVDVILIERPNDA
jgi:hypothetical protein